MQNVNVRRLVIPGWEVEYYPGGEDVPPKWMGFHGMFPQEHLLVRTPWFKYCSLEMSFMFGNAILENGYHLK